MHNTIGEQETIILIRSHDVPAYTDGAPTNMDELARVLTTLNYDVRVISFDKHVPVSPGIFQVTRWIPSSLCGFFKTSLAVTKLVIVAALILMLRNSIKPALIVVEDLTFVIPLLNIFGKLKIMYVEDVLKNMPIIDQLDDYRNRNRRHQLHYLKYVKTVIVSSRVSKFILENKALNIKKCPIVLYPNIETPNVLEALYTPPQQVLSILDSNSIVILAFGDYIPETNFKLAIDSFERLQRNFHSYRFFCNNIYLVICGACRNKDQFIYMNKLTKNRSHGQNIIFIKNISCDLIMPLIKVAKCILFTSEIYNHDQMLLMQCLRMGKIVIATECGITNEFIQHRRNGYISDPTINKFVYYIMKILTEPSNHRAMETKVQIDFTNHHSTQQYISKLKHILDNCIYGYEGSLETYFFDETVTYNRTLWDTLPEEGSDESGQQVINLGNVTLGQGVLSFDIQNEELQDELEEEEEEVEYRNSHFDDLNSQDIHDGLHFSLDQINPENLSSDSNSTFPHLFLSERESDPDFWTTDFLEENEFETLPNSLAPISTTDEEASRERQQPNPAFIESNDDVAVAQPISNEENEPKIIPECLVPTNTDDEESKEEGEPNNIPLHSTLGESESNGPQSLLTSKCLKGQPQRTPPNLLFSESDSEFPFSDEDKASKEREQTYSTTKQQKNEEDGNKTATSQVKPVRVDTPRYIPEKQEKNRDIETSPLKNLDDSNTDMWSKVKRLNWDLSISDTESETSTLSLMTVRDKNESLDSDTLSQRTSISESILTDVPSLENDDVEEVHPSPKKKLKIELHDGEEVIVISSDDE